MEALARIRCFLLDMDGTIYLDNLLLPGAAEFIQTLRQQKKRFLFLTNNSSRDKQSYVDKLRSFGIAVGGEQVLTSGEATAGYLAEIHPGAKLFLLATPALAKEFRQHGFQLVAKSEAPDYVVVGFDTTLTYQKLWDACDLIRAGVAYVATHPDFNCPLAGGKYMPDAGAIIAFIEGATGRRPKIIGKPHPEMAAAALAQCGAIAAEVAVVGDRLYTDIALAEAAGLSSILVLSGETKAEDLPGGYKLDYVFPSVLELAEALKGGGVY